MKLVNKSIKDKYIKKALTLIEKAEHKKLRKSIPKYSEEDIENEEEVGYIDTFTGVVILAFPVVLFFTYFYFFGNM